MTNTKSLTKKKVPLQIANEIYGDFPGDKVL